MNPLKILIMGLPGSGKTTLAKNLARLIKAIHFNADDIRNNVNKDLGFTLEDRIEQARRMGYLCNLVNDAGYNAIADFVCPTKECREAFNASHAIWLSTIQEHECKYQDTAKLFKVTVKELNEKSHFMYIITDWLTIDMLSILKFLGAY